MKNKMKEALSDVLQGTVDAGLKTSFTERELKEYGIIIKKIDFDREDGKTVWFITPSRPKSF